jgi:hypothetical protein
VLNGGVRGSQTVEVLLREFPSGLPDGVRVGKALQSATTRGKLATLEVRAAAQPQP